MEHSQNPRVLSREALIDLFGEKETERFIAYVIASSTLPDKFDVNSCGDEILITGIVRDHG